MIILKESLLTEEDRRNLSEDGDLLDGVAEVLKEIFSGEFAVTVTRSFLGAESYQFLHADGTRLANQERQFLFGPYGFGNSTPGRVELEDLLQNGAEMSEAFGNKNILAICRSTLDKAGVASLK